MTNVHLGAALIGLVLGAMWAVQPVILGREHWHEHHLSLFGITTLQAYQYFTKYSKDALWLKLSVSQRAGARGRYFTTIWQVIVLCLLDTIHLCFSVHTIYFYLIDNFGEADAVYGIVWYVVHHMYSIIHSLNHTAQEHQRLVESNPPNGLLS